jgi:uncharacterized protein (TIGR00369 family)
MSSGFSSANPHYDADVRRRILASPVCAFFGFEVEAVGEGEITLALPVRPELGHVEGFFQGAIIGAMVDYAGSYAAYTLIHDDWNRLTLDFTVKFLAPARGQRLVGRGRVLSHGRSLSTTAVDIAVVDGGVETLCATGLATVRHTPARAR